MQVDFNPVLSEKQTLAWDALEKDYIDELLYGGAKYGGKSWFLCVWAYLFACNLAVNYNIPKSDKPLPVGFLGRKVAKNFCDTTLETWFKTIPTDGYVAKGNPVELIIDDRVKIHTGGLDNREQINKFNSAEYAFFAIDQAEEVTQDDISLLRGATFGRLVINGHALPGKGLFTANPRNCWLKNEFIFNPPKNRVFVPALPTDNPYCTQKYIDNLKDAFKHRPGLLAAYLEGKWDALEGADQVILQKWLNNAKCRGVYEPFVKEYLVCDTARYGDDNTVIFHMINANIEHRWSLPKTATTDISNRLATLSHQYDDCQIVVESTGADLGAGVVDELIALGREVIVFNPAGETTKYEVVGTTPAGKEIKKKLYGNLRGQAWSEGAKKLQSGILDEESNMPLYCPNMYERLENQLITPRYKFLKGKVLIEEKAEIKKPERLGESPDDADTYIISLWAWDKIDKKEDRKLPTTLRDAYRKKPKVSAMAG